MGTLMLEGDDRIEQATNEMGQKERRSDAFRRLVESADAHPGVIEEGPLTSDQRNER